MNDELKPVVVILTVAAVLLSMVAFVIGDWRRGFTIIGLFVMSIVFLYGIQWWRSTSGGVRWRVARERHRRLRKERAATQKG